MKRVLLSLVVIAGLVGCATPLPEMNTDFLCQHFGNNYAGKTDRVPSIRAEIESRKLLSQKEWEYVNRRELYVGMTTCAMYAVQGGPYAQNSTTTASGTVVQHVFTNYHSLKREYVYTTNGLVTAWQK